MTPLRHQYIDRRTGEVKTEQLFGDPFVCAIYSDLREKAPVLYRAVTGKRMSQLLGFLNYDFALTATLSGSRRFMKSAGIDYNECLDPADSLDTPRKVFERKIRYWECRPMPDDRSAVVSPADARVLVGSFNETGNLLIKGKFFDYEELLGNNKHEWLNAFRGGDFAVFRLTPDKYHYNHTPVAGQVEDFYEITGVYHSCNPSAVVTVVTPFSKNTRTVTIINTDVSNGSNVGLVAMIEVTALMIGEVLQCYSSREYTNPQPIRRGMFLEKGCPKSLYRPGSSTDIVIFQKDRISFDPDITENMYRLNAQSRFSFGFGQSLLETEIEVRSQIAVGEIKEDICSIKNDAVKELVTCASDR